MIDHFSIQLEPKPRGFHLATDEILEKIGDRLPEKALVHLMIMHTAAGLCINENADPTVLEDFELFFDRLAPENLPGLKHTLEGPDDMPAHIKSVLTGHEITLPVINGKFSLGTWQGIYLCEFRNRPRSRNIQVTIIS